MSDRLETLQSIFGAKIFRIPDYQRGYAWTEEHLAAFWEDLINLPNDKNHYTGMLSLQLVPKEAVRTWGEIDWKIDQGSEGYYVVDGQQRLTTCVILIQCMIEFVERYAEPGQEATLNNETITEIRRRYLYDLRENSQARLKAFIFSYEEKNPSYEFFKTKILGAEKVVQTEETFYTLNLAKAKEFFTKQLEEFYTEALKNEAGEKAVRQDAATEEDKKVARQKATAEVQEVYKKLTQNLKFNQYIIENDFDVFVTFETMNNRGKKLTALELLKNRLIYLSTLFDDGNDKGESKAKLRREINRAWQVVYSYLGKNKDTPMSDDTFLREHCVVYFGYGKKQRKFEDFLLKDYFTQKRVLEKTVEVVSVKVAQDDFEDDDAEADETEENNVDVAQVNYDQNRLTLADTLDYVESLREMSVHWYNLYFPEQSDLPADMKTWLSRLQRCQSANFRPLIFAMLSRDDIPTEEKVECLKLIESYIFFYFAMSGYRSNHQRTVFFNLAHELFAKKISLAEVMQRLRQINCLEETEDGRRILRISAVTSNIKRLFEDGGGYYSWTFIRYFLFEYETWLMNENRVPQRIFPAEFFATRGENDKTSIEHIFPQKPNKNDDRDDSWRQIFGKYTADEQKILNGSLGNLLPMSLGENIDLHNYSFAKKCERYRRGSVSESEVGRTTKEVNGKIKEWWDADAILMRGCKLLDFMAERWNFEFRQDYDKIKLLNLEFLQSKPEDYEEEPEMRPKGQTTGARAVITPEMIEAAYGFAKRVYLEEISPQAARKQLCDKYGMNENSAAMYLDCFGHMMKGEVYTRQISASAAKHYIDNITKDFGDEYGKLAQRAVELNREYLREVIKK